MLRTSLAFLSVALLLASPARAQGRAGGCASGSSAAGAMLTQARVANGGGTNFVSFGSNLAASYGGTGTISNASTAGATAMYGTNAGTAAAYYGTGIGGYGSAAWSYPYAMTDNGYGNSSGFGLMNDMNFGPMYGMTDGFSSIAANAFNSPGDAFDAAERSSTNTTPRTRSRSTKSRSKVKHRSKRIAAAPR